MKILTNLQQEIREEVKTRLSKEPWFKGVCLDDFPTDEEIKQDREGSIAQVMLNTGYWDDPNFLR